MNGIVWSEDMDAKLRQRRAEGEPFYLLADEIGVAEGTARRRAKALGISTERLVATKPVKKPCEPKEGEFADLLAEGFSPQEAGDRLGYARGNSVLQRIRGKLGWQAV